MDNPLHALTGYTLEYCLSMGDKIPEHLRDGMARYLINGVKPGGFLTSCFRNDLSGAVIKADDDGIAALPHIMRLINSVAPTEARGSARRVDEWCARGGYKGRAA